MPIYEFRCAKCKTTFDKLVRGEVTSQNPVICPSCGSKRTRRLVSRVSSYRSGSSGGGGDCAPSG